MRGRVSRKDKITVAAFRHMYMKRFATKWGETPAGKIDSIFDARIVPEKYLRGYHLDWLADHPEVIATWQETLLRSGKIRGSGGLAPSAVRNAAGYLSSMFDYAASVQMRRLTGVYANPVKDQAAEPAIPLRARETPPRKRGWTAAGIGAAFRAPAAGQNCEAWDRIRAMARWRPRRAACATARSAAWRSRTSSGRLGGSCSGRRWLAPTAAAGCRRTSAGKNRSALRVIYLPDLAMALLADHIHRNPPVAVTLPLQTVGDYGVPVCR